VKEQLNKHANISGGATFALQQQEKTKKHTNISGVATTEGCWNNNLKEHRNNHIRDFWCGNLRTSGHLSKPQERRNKESPQLKCDLRVVWDHGRLWTATARTNKQTYKV
jgi:hypothetical protein